MGFDNIYNSKVDGYLYNIKQEDLDRKVWRINNDGIRRTSKVGHTSAYHY